MYAIVNGSFALRRVWRLRGQLRLVLLQAPSLKRDALVIAFAPARLAIVDDCEGEPRTLVRYDRNMPSQHAKMTVQAQSRRRTRAAPFLARRARCVAVHRCGASAS